MGGEGEEEEDEGGPARGRKGGLSTGRFVLRLCRARGEAAANALARYGLDRRGTSLHGMCFLRLLSLALPLSYLPFLHFAIPPLAPPSSVFLPSVFLSRPLANVVFLECVCNHEFAEYTTTAKLLKIQSS